MGDRWDLLHRGIFDAADDWSAPLLPRLVLDEGAGVLRVLPESAHERVLAVEPLVRVVDLMEADDGTTRPVGRVDGDELPRMHLVVTTERAVVLASDECLPALPPAGAAGREGGHLRLVPGGDAVDVVEACDGSAVSPLLEAGDAVLAELDGRVLRAPAPLGPGFDGLGQLIAYLQRVVRFAATSIPWPSVTAVRVGHPWGDDLPADRSLGLRLTVAYPSRVGITHWLVVALARPSRVASLRERLFSVAVREKAALFRARDCARSLLLLGEVVADGLEPYAPGRSQHTSLGPATISTVA